MPVVLLKKQLGIEKSVHTKTKIKHLLMPKIKTQQTYYANNFILMSKHQSWHVSMIYS